MTSYLSKSSGFIKLELILYISIFLVLFFLLLPFYNSWMISESDGSSSNDNNAQFHFESWNEGTSDSNITND